ncbi:MAG: hypothetical protein QM792_01225 [Piscinibacter sp.]
MATISTSQARPSVCWLVEIQLEGLPLSERSSACERYTLFGVRPPKASRIGSSTRRARCTALRSTLSSWMRLSMRWRTAVSLTVSS